MHMLIYLLFFFLVCSRLASSQECDSFVCLREFHQDLTNLKSSRNSLCSATQTYIYCLRKSTVICTTLTIHEMTEVATLLMSHAVCKSAAANKALSVPVLLVSLISFLCLSRAV